MASKRWEMGVWSRENTRTSFFRFKLMMLPLAMFAIQACNENQPAGTVDSTKVVTSNGNQDAPVKSLSVTPPNSPVPKQVADSIWDGDFIEKYPNGIIKKRGYIKGGLASGEWLTFYEDGTPYSKGAYHSGYRTGYGVSWYHDGQKSSEGYYYMGKTVGVWKYWSEQGHNLIEKDYGGQLPDTTGTIK
jgi:hypothetical protein